VVGCGRCLNGAGPDHPQPINASIGAVMRRCACCPGPSGQRAVKAEELVSIHVVQAYPKQFAGTEISRTPFGSSSLVFCQLHRLVSGKPVAPTEDCEYTPDRRWFASVSESVIQVNETTGGNRGKQYASMRYLREPW
jgi:hypothetical protein